MTTHENHIISVTGVSGAGKDYLLKHTHNTQLLEQRLPVINAGTQLMELLKLKGLITKTTTRDELKFILNDDNLLGYVREIITTLNPKNKYIFNGHVVTKSGDFLKINPEIEKEISPKKYVVIIADPKDIKKWRELEQNLTLAIITSLAVTLAIDLTVIENNPSNLNDNTEFLRNL